MRASKAGLVYCCGVSVIGSFDIDVGIPINELTRDRYEKSGTGYYVSTFNQYQKKAYEAMCKQYQLVCQTSPRKNRFSNNQVFIAIFKEKK